MEEAPGWTTCAAAALGDIDGDQVNKHQSSLMISIMDALPLVLVENILFGLKMRRPVDAAGARCVCTEWDEILRSHIPADGADLWLVLLFRRPMPDGDGPFRLLDPQQPAVQPVAQLEVQDLAAGQPDESEPVRARKCINSLGTIQCDPLAAVELSQFCGYDHKFKSQGACLEVTIEDSEALLEMVGGQEMVAEEENGEQLVLDCWMVDPNSSRWYQLALPPLHPSKSYIIRSAGRSAGRSGLLAIFENSSLQSSYWIGNPMTNTWRNIKSPGLYPCSYRNWSSWMTSDLIVNEQSATYKIVQLRVCTQDMRNMELNTWPHLIIRTAVFDSASNSWLTRSMASTCQRGALASTCGSSGSVYILLINQQEYKTPELERIAIGALRATVLAYDVEANKFKTTVPASNVTYWGSGGAPSLGASIVWQSMQLLVREDASTSCNNSPSDVVLEIWAGITSDPEYDELDFMESWPLEGFCVLRFDQAAQIWRVESTSYLVPEQDCQMTPAGGRSECLAFDVSPLNGTQLYLTALDPVFTMLGKLTDGARLYSPLGFPSQFRCHVGPSTSCATIIPRFDIKP